MALTATTLMSAAEAVANGQVQCQSCVWERKLMLENSASYKIHLLLSDFICLCH